MLMLRRYDIIASMPCAFAMPRRCLLPRRCHCRSAAFAAIACFISSDAACDYFLRCRYADIAAMPDAAFRRFAIDLRERHLLFFAAISRHALSHADAAAADAPLPSFSRAFDSLAATSLPPLSRFVIRHYFSFMIFPFALLRLRRSAFRHATRYAATVYDASLPI